MRNARQTCAAFALADVQSFYDALSAFNEILYRPGSLLEFQLKTGVAHSASNSTLLHVIHLTLYMSFIWPIAIFNVHYAFYYAYFGLPRL